MPLLQTQLREGSILDTGSFRESPFPPKTILQSPPASILSPRRGSCWVMSGTRESKGERILYLHRHNHPTHCKNKGSVGTSRLSKTTLGSVGCERRLGRKTLPGIRDLILFHVCQETKSKIPIAYFCTEPLGYTMHFFSCLFKKKQKTRYISCIPQPPGLKCVPNNQRNRP